MNARKQRRKIVIAGRYARAVQYSMTTEPDVRKTRAPKELISSCAREAINLRHSWEKFKALIAANFEPTDLVIALTYSDNMLPRVRKDAENKLKLFIRRLRAERRINGGELQYMYVTEQGHTSGRLHHHMIVNTTGDDFRMIRKLWMRNGDNIEFNYIADKGYDGWARYLTKEPREYGRHQVGERMWRSSKNLAKPLVYSGWVDAGDDLAAPPGAYVIDHQRRDNAYGRFEFIEYIMPKESNSDPSISF